MYTIVLDIQIPMYTIVLDIEIPMYTIVFVKHAYVLMTFSNYVISDSFFTILIVKV